MSLGYPSDPPLYFPKSPDPDFVEEDNFETHGEDGIKDDIHGSLGPDTSEKTRKHESFIMTEQELEAKSETESSFRR
ncbi:hypothetical protein DXG01_016053, partial [Tephrocybe rancida]